MKEESLFSLANENESTPLAEIIAKHTKAHFITFSTVTSSIKDICQIMEEAEQNRQFGEKMILSLSMKSIGCRPWWRNTSILPWRTTASTS